TPGSGAVEFGVAMNIGRARAVSDPVDTVPPVAMVARRSITPSSGLLVGGATIAGALAGAVILVLMGQLQLPALGAALDGAPGSQVDPASAIMAPAAAPAPVAVASPTATLGSNTPASNDERLPPPPPTMRSASPTPPLGRRERTQTAGA